MNIDAAKRKRGFTAIDNCIIIYQKELGMTHEELGLIINIAKTTPDYLITYDDLTQGQTSVYSIKRKLNTMVEKGFIVKKRINRKTKDGFRGAGHWISLDPLMRKITELWKRDTQSEEVKEPEDWEAKEKKIDSVLEEYEEESDEPERPVASIEDLFSVNRVKEYV